MTSRVRLRPDIEAMQPYRQGKPAAPDAFKLSSNENPYDPLPAVVEAIGTASVNRYPDGTASVLRARLAERHGVDIGQVQVGAGSVSVLSQLITAASGAGDEVVYSWRSFEAYPGLVTVSGATSVTVPNSPDFRHDLPAMAAAITERTRLAIVCSPNNPTSTVVTAAEFATFMAGVPETVLVVIDEAYFEFESDPDVPDGMSYLDRPNVVVLRTFSKAYGLAGLRIGYGVAHDPAIVAAIRKTQVPFAVSQLAQEAALACFEPAAEKELRGRVEEVVAERARVTDALRVHGFVVPPSQANFVWLPLAARTMEFSDHCESRGVIVRAFADAGARVTIGRPDENDHFLAAATTFAL